MSLEKLLKQVLELEGLILVAKNRQEYPQMVNDLIREKCVEIGNFCPQCQPCECANQPTEVQATIDNLPDDEPDEDITVEFVDEDTENADLTEEIEQNEAQQPEADQPQTADEEFVETTYVVYDEQQPVEAEIFDESAYMPAEEAPAEETASEPEEEAKLEENTDETADSAATEEEVTPAEEVAAPEAKPATNNDDDENENIKLDEALQRSMTKDLRQAFSLNDRFRFRRELFSNSDVVMNETLSLIDTMGSFDEAEDFFYNNLDWDYDSPEVADFMLIIKNHFWNKRHQV